MMIIIRRIIIAFVLVLIGSLTLLSIRNSIQLTKQQQQQQQQHHDPSGLVVGQRREVEDEVVATSGSTSYRRRRRHDEHVQAGQGEKRKIQQHQNYDKANGTVPKIIPGTATTDSSAVSPPPPPPAAAASAANKKKNEYVQQNMTTTKTSTAAATTTVAPNTTVQNLTIIVDSPWYTYGLSLFQAKTLDRFKSNRIHYMELISQKCRREEEVNNKTLTSTTPITPCLVVTNNIKRSSTCHTRYPQCKIMLLSDEFCKLKSSSYSGRISVRLYDSRKYHHHHHHPSTSTAAATSTDDDIVYMPLGPRRDFWKVYQEMILNNETLRSRRRDEDEQLNNDNNNHHQSSLSSLLPTKTQLIKPTSSRKYVYNAMFSRGTNSKSRDELARILQQNNHNNYNHNSDTNTSNINTTNTTTQYNNNSSKRYNYPAVHQIAEKWVSKIEKSNDHLQPYEYANILLDSMFTLCPIGHNPDCFRFYEAIECGSIPVIALDQYYRNHKCVDALYEIIQSNAPIVILQNWNELFTRFDGMFNNTNIAIKNNSSVVPTTAAASAHLDKQQRNLLRWYDKFMRTAVYKFENIFFNNTNNNGNDTTTTTTAIPTTTS